MTTDTKDIATSPVVAKMSDLIKSFKPQMAALLGKHASVDQMFQIALLSLSRNPKLAECTGASVLGCVLEASRQRLPVGVAGGVWLIPRENKKIGVMECTMVVDYRAIIAMMKRDAGVKTVLAERVHANDKFSRGIGTKGPFLLWEPSNGDRGAMIGYVAGSWMADGTLTGYIYKTTEEIVKDSKSRSMAASDGPWVTDPDWMCKKSVLRPLSKLNPGYEGSGLERAVALDERADLGLGQNLHLLADPTGKPSEDEARKVDMPKSAPQTYAEKVAWFGAQFAKLGVTPEAFAHYIVKMESKVEGEEARIQNLRVLADEFKAKKLKPEVIFSIPADAEQTENAGPLAATFKVHSVSDSEFGGEEAVAVRTYEDPQRKFFAVPALKAIFADAKKDGAQVAVTYEMRKPQGGKTEHPFVLTAEKAKA